MGERLIWPDVITAGTGGFIVFENLASIMHFVAGFLFALVAGCAAPMFAGYLVYQLVTTLAKTVLFPELHPWSDWGWDFFGDNVELLAGYGLVYAVGLGGRVEPRGGLAWVCGSRGVLALWSGLMLVWLFLLGLTLV